jgi:hypothetical protein
MRSHLSPQPEVNYMVLPGDLYMFPRREIKHVHGGRDCRLIVRATTMTRNATGAAGSGAVVTGSGAAVM